MSQSRNSNKFYHNSSSNSKSYNKSISANDSQKLDMKNNKRFDNDQSRESKLKFINLKLFKYNQIDL